MHILLVSLDREDDAQNSLEHCLHICNPRSTNTTSKPLFFSFLQLLQSNANHTNKQKKTHIPASLVCAKMTSCCLSSSLTKRAVSATSMNLVHADRKSFVWGRRVSVSVEPGGQRRINN